jgi:hypothetical protein
MIDPTTAVAVAAAKPIATKLFETLLKPFVSVAQGVADPLVDVFGDRFSEYLSRQLVKHSYLPTIVFQVKQNLEDIYVPLTVVEDTTFTMQEPKVEFTLNQYDKSFIPKLERVLIIDSAGMGKTTLSRFLFLQAIRTLATVPIFIELRHLTSGKSILEYLLAELNPMGSDPKDPKIDRRQLVRLLEKGVFTFFLDGYDEVSNAQREAVTRDIKMLTESYPANKFLITSRPEHALASFPSFQVFRIRNLDKREAFLLIRKYDRNGEKGEKLIARLSDDTLPQVNHFLQNPLLTTLLYRAYDYKAQIPLKKANFYRQVFDALFEWHDLSKDGYSTREKTCKLDIDGFHKVLRGLGFVSIMKGKVEADTDEMLAWVREAKTYAPDLKFSESDFLEDAIKAVPIFRREGDTIIWSHKSLAEYFCANFIVMDARSDQEKICSHLANTFYLQEFRNVLDLLYDMDIVLFGSHFILPLLAFYELELARLTGLFPEIPSEKIELRAAASFGMRPFILSAPPKKTKSGQQVEERIRQISRDAMEQWYGLEAEYEDGGLFDTRLHLGFDSHSERTVLRLSHALRTVFSILAVKKHSLILAPAFYPPNIQKGAILGTRDWEGAPINETLSSVWNKAKNFSNTTSVLARGSHGILNTSKINQVKREIDQISGRSKTTASLLMGLGALEK